ncbi:hypothetical protein QF032_007787 [Streptomyces achromogenes]|uniref:Bacterial DNA polymerase III alpha subunit NTPase domain-containing protein n=1 Tax=Streptomyces achromogenes TaxID=67255 RepID=A0ABU0QDM1_STRAH|nr:hypothetical protein [Streptomyces achromogenes]MDQ0835943.1 hypothetical protein [Streptomyces achromogenes]
MVNHALFVASANPLEHRLLFERFLSERHTSLPDIDLDVESERRGADRGLRYVQLDHRRGHAAVGQAGSQRRGGTTDGGSIGKPLVENPRRVGRGARTAVTTLPAKIWRSSSEANGR